MLRLGFLPCAIFLLAACGPARAQEAPAFALKDCAELEAEHPPGEAAAMCRLPVEDISEEAAAAHLGAGDFTVLAEESLGVLTILQRAPGEAQNLCCSLRAPLQRIGASDLWAARFRLERLPEAMLLFATPSGDFVPWRGSRAPAPLPENETLLGKLEERELPSTALGETRRFTVYTPPGFDPKHRRPVIIVADGFNPKPLDALMAAGRIAPVIMVALYSGQNGIKERRSDLRGDIRGLDYLPDFGGAENRFDAHLRFVADELLPWLQRDYGASAAPGDIAVAGFSNGAVFALHAALRRPDRFGHAFVMSPGWPRRPAEPREGPRARFLLSGGLYEPLFRRSARTSYEILRAAGYEVGWTELAAGHMLDQENHVLARRLQETFPAARAE